MVQRFLLVSLKDQPQARRPPIIRHGPDTPAAQPAFPALCKLHPENLNSIGVTARASPWASSMQKGSGHGQLRRTSAARTLSIPHLPKKQHLLVFWLKGRGGHLPICGKTSGPSQGHGPFGLSRGNAPTLPEPAKKRASRPESRRGDARARCSIKFTEPVSMDP